MSESYICIMGPALAARVYVTSRDSQAPGLADASVCSRPISSMFLAYISGTAPTKIGAAPREVKLAVSDAKGSSLQWSLSELRDAIR